MTSSRSRPIAPRGIIAIVAALAPWLAIGCAAGSIDATGGGDPVEAVDLCAEVAAILCDAERDCCDRADADCEGEQRDACRAALEPLALDPRLGYTPAGAAAFVASLRTSAAGCWEEPVDLDAMRPALAGTGALDADCTPRTLAGAELLAASLSCVDAAACRLHLLTDGRPAGVCEPRDDDACSHPHDCGAGAFCNAGASWEPGVWGACQPLRTDGWACAGDRECASRFCDRGTCALRPASRRCLASSYDEVVHEDRPIGYWRLGDRERGAARDASGHDHHGSYVGGATREAEGALAGGDDGAVRVDATPRYVRIPSIDALTSAPRASLEGWFRIDTVESVHPILELADEDGAVGLHVWAYDSGDRIYASFVGADGASHPVMSEPGALEAGRWYHVVATYDGSVGRLYLDGVQIGEVAVGMPLRGGELDLFVGHRRALDADRPAVALVGAIDEVAVYDRALDAESVRRHHVAGAEGRAPNAFPLFAWLR